MIDTPPRPGTIYLRLLHNRTFVLLWSGSTISMLGDALFTVAVMWVVYVRTGSALQTGIISIIYTLSAVVLGPFAGVYADRWDRKRVMLGAAILSAIFVGAAAIPIMLGFFSPVVIYGTVFALSAVGFFSGPAQRSAMPEIVGSDLLAASGGLFALVDQGTSLVGAGLAGLILASLGVSWALLADAVSFLVATLSIQLASIPARASRAVSTRPSVLGELREGWRVVRAQPVVRAFVWITALVNVSSFMGPLFPALVRLQIQGGVKDYAFLEAASVLGGIAGGLVAGELARRMPAGRLIAVSFAVAGLCFAALGISTSLWLDAVLFVTATFFLIASDVTMAALTPILIPKAFRGRASGITRAAAVITMPVTILLGGWFADQIGPGPLYVVGGLWATGIGALVWANPHLRAGRFTGDSVR